jgi:hypothetical protein
MKLWTMIVYTGKWIDAPERVNSVSFKKKVLFTKKDWFIENLVSFSMMFDVYKIIRENCIGIDQEEVDAWIKTIKPTDNKIIKNFRTFVIILKEEELPDHPNVSLCDILKEEIEKTVKIYVNEDNQYISLSMHKAVKNLVQIRNTY